MIFKARMFKAQMSKGFKLFLVCLCINLIGCSTLYWQQGLSTSTPKIEQEVWRHEFLFGFWEGQSPLKLSQLCPESQFETLQVRRSPLQAGIGLLTLGLYTPQSVGAVCRTEL